MIVCKQCLMAIESHEGHQRKEKLIYTDLYDEDKEETECEWCNEVELSSEMYVI